MSDLVERLRAPSATVFRSRPGTSELFPVRTEALPICLEAANEIERLRACSTEEVQRLKNLIDTSLNNYLVDMKPDFDDSITGFNQAWGIVGAAFAGTLSRLKEEPHTPETLTDAATVSGVEKLMEGDGI